MITRIDMIVWSVKISNRILVTFNLLRMKFVLWLTRAMFVTCTSYHSLIVDMEVTLFSVVFDTDMEVDMEVDMDTEDGKEQVRESVDMNQAAISYSYAPCISIPCTTIYYILTSGTLTSSCLICASRVSS